MPTGVQFETVYEFSPLLIAGWPFFLAGLVGAPFVVWWSLWSGAWYQRVVAWTVLAGLLFGFGRIALYSSERHFETIERIRSGTLLVVEGNVSNVRCLGKERHVYTVGDVQFDAGPTRFQPGFESGAAFSKSVREGMRVRIHYFNATWGRLVVTKLENDVTTGVLPIGIQLFGPCGA